MGYQTSQEAIARRQVRDARRGKHPVRDGLLVTASGLTIAGYLGGPAIAEYTDNYHVPEPADCSNVLVTNALQGQAQNLASLSDPVYVMAGTRHQPTENEVVRDMVNDPASRSSLILQAILNNGYSRERVRDSAGEELGEPNNRTGLSATATENPLSRSYVDSCPVRSDLLDLKIFNPARYDPATYINELQKPENYIQFRSLMSYEDKPSSNKMAAYFHPETGTLLIHTTGRTYMENTDRGVAVAAGNTERVVPYAFTERFLTELRDQIRDQGLKVRNTAIFSHSLGVSGGLVIKGMLETSHANQVVFGKNPVLTMVEGFGESMAAEDVSYRLNVPLEKLRANSVSVRYGGDGDASLVGAEWANNHTIGERVYQIVVTGQREEIIDPDDNHGLTTLTQRLVHHAADIKPYSGTFMASGYDYLRGKGLEVAGQVAELGRTVRNGLGLGR